MQSHWPLGLSACRCSPRSWLVGGAVRFVAHGLPDVRPTRLTSAGRRAGVPSKMSRTSSAPRRSLRRRRRLGSAPEQSNRRLPTGGIWQRSYVHCRPGIVPGADAHRESRLPRQQSSAPRREHCRARPAHFRLADDLPLAIAVRNDVSLGDESAAHGADRAFCDVTLPLAVGLTQRSPVRGIRWGAPQGVAPGVVPARRASTCPLLFCAFVEQGDDSNHDQDS